MANEIKITLAGDASSLQKAFDKVGQSSQAMAAKVGSSADAFDQSARQAGKLGETLDKASGASSQLSGGLGDVGGALTEAFGEDSGIGQFGAQMESAGTIVMGFTGVMDLAMLANTALSASFVKNAAAAVGSKIAMAASATATGLWTAAQWLLNLALTANPIGLIIVGIGLLIGVIVLIATKTTWFQDAWRVVWTFVKDKAVDVWEWLKTLPDKIGDTFSRVAGFISAPFRAAFNAVSDAWNNTVGRLSWSVPSWVPGLGGGSISAPRLPRFHSGGVVPGAPGQEMMALLQAGERVTPAGRSGAATVIEIRSGGSALDDLLVDLLSNAVRVRGGNVQLVLGA